jgi:glutaryl-CoA dehydrogenase
MSDSHRFSWSDPFMLDLQLTDDERQVKEAAASYTLALGRSPVYRHI